MLITTPYLRRNEMGILKPIRFKPSAKALLIIAATIILAVAGFSIWFFNRPTPEKALRGYIKTVSKNERVKAAKYLLINEAEVKIWPKGFVIMYENAKPLVLPPRYQKIPFRSENYVVENVKITEDYVWGEDAFLSCLVIYKRTGLGEKNARSFITGKQVVPLRKENRKWKIVSPEDFENGWYSPLDLCIFRMKEIAVSLWDDEYIKALEKQLPPKAENMKPYDYGLSYYDYYTKKRTSKSYGTSLSNPPAEYKKAPKDLMAFPICAKERTIIKYYNDPVTGQPFKYRKVSDRLFRLYAPKPEVLGKKKVILEMKLDNKPVSIEYRYGETTLVLEAVCWVWDSSIITDPPEPRFEKTEVNPFIKNENTLTVTADALNVRSSPNTESTPVTLVEKGTILTYEEEKDGWFRVRLSDGSEGWVCGGENGEPYVEKAQ